MHMQNDLDYAFNISSSLLNLPVKHEKLEITAREIHDEKTCSIAKLLRLLYTRTALLRGSNEYKAGTESASATPELFGETWLRLKALVQAKGQMGYIGSRREKEACVVKDVVSGKTLVEVAPVH